MQKGFTLIELLVIILIIGILVAVALPYYKSAVNQSRFGTMMSATRALKEAQERMFLSTNSYTDDASSLDIQIAGTYDENQITTPDVTYTLENTENTNAITAVHNKLPDNVLVLYLSRSPNYADNIHCEAVTDAPEAVQICESQSQNDGLLGDRDGYSVYKLEGNSTGDLSVW